MSLDPTATPSITEFQPLNANTLQRDMVAVGKMVAPLIVLVVLGAYFYSFVIKSILANVEINGLIIVTILYGTGLIISRFVNAQRDFQIIERFGAEAISGRPMQEIAEEPWIRQRYVRHYFKHVAAMEMGSSVEASRHGIESELHALNDEYNSKLELPQFLVGFMIALGLLGTFIGLLETLTGISGMLDGIGGSGGGAAMDAQFTKLVGELQKPLAGMGIAFSASMFGLIGSLVLAVMMINLRRYIARVIMCARNVMHDIIEIKQISEKQNSAGGMLVVGDMQALVQAQAAPRPVQAETLPPHPAPVAEARTVREPESTEHLVAMESSVMLLASRIDVLAGKMEGVARAVEESASATRHLNEQMGYGPKMKEVGELTYETVKGNC